MKKDHHKGHPGKGPAVATGELETYRSKRTAGSTPEPFGEGAVPRPPQGTGLFVVQKHAARNLHFDLRIQVGGVLKSWAIPRGPSLDPQEKRFAIITEDHPLEYADFEGVIPAGNYGAGAMIVWDRGRCEAHIDHAEGLRDGKLLFELYGYKLRGLWTLVRTQRPKEWLLIKKPDAYGTGEDPQAMGEGSVFSGLTVEDLRDGHSRVDEIRRRLEELDVPQRPVVAEDLRVVLCEQRRTPFDGADWLFEIKYDGYRLLASRQAGVGNHRDRRGARFFFRSGKESTVAFPDLARALVSLPGGPLILDGEVVCLDDEGKPSFHRLQKRARLTRPLDAETASIALPATYFVFDFLAFEDYDLRGLPLVQRKELLQLMLPPKGPIRYVEHIMERGKAFFAGVEQLGLEGMVAKKAQSTYGSGRSSNWQKVRLERRGDFMVVGFQLPEGGRSGFRGLHLAGLEDGQLAYVGRVGSGFNEAQLKDLRQELDALRRDEAPTMLGERVAEPDRDVWVEAQLVVEVRYSEVTPLGHLRHPVFEGRRDDRRPEDCVHHGILSETAVAQLAAEQLAAKQVAAEQRQTTGEGPSAKIENEADLATVREVPFTNLAKVYWPDEGYTKGMLIDYYRAIAPALLPYLSDRPVVLDRYPDGIDGKSFFQKNVPDFAPEWIRTETIWSGDAADETLYFICDNVETLLYLANLGSIPLHIQSCRLGSLQNPDWCILDLDAKDAPFAHVILVAQEIHRLCQSIDLPCFAKTSGATGLHVLLPLAGQCTHDQARILGELVARVVADRLPEIASIARLPSSRPGLVYLDFLQNGHGKLLVAPYSVRPRPGAPVSMPLFWHEVAEGLDPRDFTMLNAPQRVAAWTADPLAAVMAESRPLVQVLARLGQQVQ